MIRSVIIFYRWTGDCFSAWVKGFSHIFKKNAVVWNNKQTFFEGSDYKEISDARDNFVLEVDELLKKYGNL